MLDITVDEIRNILGTETKSRYGNFYFQCPDCARGGGDTRKNNLVYNSDKNVLKCFACETGAKTVLSLINENRNNTGYYSKTKPKTVTEPTKKECWYKKNKNELLQYMDEAYYELLDNTHVIDWLKNKHGIEYDTLENTYIGYDDDKKAVCFPIFRIDNTFVGFEYRQVGEEKKIWRTPQVPSCLATVWGAGNAKKMIILEGYLDCYCFLQFLKKKNLHHEYSIVTPANGVTDTFKNIKNIDFSKHELFYLMLDNDKAGQAETEKIIEKYPFFKDKSGFLKKNDCKDFKEYWVKNYASL